MGGLPGSQMKNSEKNSAERAHRKRIKPKPLDVRGGVGTSGKDSFSGAVGRTACLVQETMRREELETESRTDCESFPIKWGPKNQVVAGEQREAKDSRLLFLLLFMGEIIVMGKTH